MADISISQQLHSALSKAHHAGSFCVQGSALPLLSGLEIDGVGSVVFPIRGEMALAIKRRCKQAPYGRGAQTIVDTNVRRVWQLEPSQFRLTGPEWSNFLEATLETVGEELGLGSRSLKAHLYNLLLYEKGSFFLPHRDGERLDRMVATLVVVPPASYTGGELVVRHEGREQVLDLGNRRDSRLRTHFAAFYADCEHEVRPIRQGVRLCLVYNLTLAKGKKTVQAPRTSKPAEAVAAILRDWQSTTRKESPRKLAVTLTHQYTQSGLSWDGLKGVDRARAQILREAAHEAGCRAFLAQLTLWESGAAADDGSSMGYGRRSWYDDYSDDYDDEDEDDGDSGEHEMEEVFETSLTAEHWIDEHGQRPLLGKLNLSREEVVPPESLTTVKPEEDFEGYTGNEGMTLERWYRHAAIILWPEKRHFEIVCSSATENPVEALAFLVSKWRKAGRSAKETLREQCLDLARHVIASWRVEPEYRRHVENRKRCELAPILGVLGEPGFMRAFLNLVVSQDASVDVADSFLKACEKIGWPTFADALATVFGDTTQATLPRNSRLLETLCTGKWKKEKPWRSLCDKLAREMVKALAAIDRRQDDWNARPLDRSKILPALIRSLHGIGDSETLDGLLAHVLEMPKRYPLREVQVPVLLAVRPLFSKRRQVCPALSRWLAETIESLEAQAGAKPQAPVDFRRESTLGCSCRDCQELAAFLRDPREQVHRFPMGKPRRKHLHRIIDRNSCDVTHVTERRGSPQTLVCTKTDAGYRRRLKQYGEDQKHLKTLRAMMRAEWSERRSSGRKERRAAGGARRGQGKIGRVRP
jgi:predicted 2-oxoglutarate/Fe(II)-dependent dioxygenase YbiX